MPCGVASESSHPMFSPCSGPCCNPCSPHGNSCACQAAVCSAAWFSRLCSSGELTFPSCNKDYALVYWSSTAGKQGKRKH